MKKLLLALIVVLAACGSDTAAPTALSASGAWARSSTPGATNGVVYLTLASPTADAVVSASVPAEVAATAELHETMGGGGGAAMPNMPNMASGNGQMTMTPVQSVEVPAGGSVAFEPGGKHIMLTALAAPLKAGDHFTLTLTMKSRATLPVDVLVADNAP